MSEISPVSGAKAHVIPTTERPWGLQAVLLVLLTVLAYIPVLGNGFIWDDDLLITGNRLVQAPDGIYRFWLTTESRDYYPLIGSFWWLEWRLWGNNARGYHAVNIALHAVNVLLIWMILRKLKIPGAWLAALVFGVHPVNVSTVAWISEQKNTLSMLFYATAILLYLKFSEQERWCWYVFSLAAFLLALLSKSAVVMLPFVLLGCVWWVYGRVRRRDFLRIAPFFALSLLLGLVTVWFQYSRVLKWYAIRTDGFASQLASAGWAPWFYLSKALLPLNLCMVYPMWNIDAMRWVSYLPGIALLGCFALFWWKRNSWGRALLFGFGYFVVTLFPVLGFFDQGFYRYSLVADHWQYYSIVGVIALVVAGGETISQRTAREQRRYLGVFAGIVVVTLGALAWQHSKVFHDQTTLFTDNLAHNPQAWVAHNNLGLELIKSGRKQEGVEHFRQALKINPNYADAEDNLAAAALPEGRMQEAIQHYEQALRIAPGNANSESSLGYALLQVGRVAESIKHCEEALQLDPELAEAHNNLGSAMLRMGRVQYAISHGEQALRINPNFPEAHYNLANALFQSGRLAEAIGHYQQAVRLKPDYAEAYSNLGAALLQAGSPEEGIKQFEESLRLNPNQPETHNNMGVTLARMGRVNEAIAHFKEALRLKPDFSDAQKNLARALADQSAAATEK